jgi:hypothetical protein
MRSFERGSNVTDVSDLQSKKHDLQSTSTEEGTINAVEPLFANAGVRDMQLEKHGL